MLSDYKLVVLKIGQCDGESNELLVLMLQSTHTQKCALRGNELVSKYPNSFWAEGASPPLDPSAGHCLCTPPGPRQPLDPSHCGSVHTKHFLQFLCLIIKI